MAAVTATTKQTTCLTKPKHTALALQCCQVNSTATIDANQLLLVLLTDDAITRSLLLTAAAAVAPLLLSYNNTRRCQHPSAMMDIVARGYLQHI